MTKEEIVIIRRIINEYKNDKNYHGGYELPNKITDFEKRLKLQNFILEDN